MLGIDLKDRSAIDCVYVITALSVFVFLLDLHEFCC